MDWLPVRLVFCLSSTFWTLAPRDHVTYCQVRGHVGILHLTVSVFSLIYSLEDSMPPEVEEDYLPFSWSDSKWAHLVHSEEIFDFELGLLTSFWQALFGKARARPDS